jgi:hypothetical protein
MKLNRTFSDFFMRFKKLKIALLIHVSAVVSVMTISSLITVSAQGGNTGQEKPRVIPLAERIGHTDQSKAMAGKNVHQGTGTLYMQTLLGRGAVTGLAFMHHGPLMPKSSIGHHFHTNSDEMFLILDNDCEFTLMQYITHPPDRQTG